MIPRATVCNASLALVLGLLISGSVGRAYAADAVRVSVATDGTEGNGFSGAPALSDTGRIVGFVSFTSNLVEGDDNGASDVFVRNRNTGRTTLISVANSGEHGNNQSGHVGLSSTGRYVVFSSLSDNLVRNDTNERSDIFMRDRKRDRTWRISVSSSREQSNRHSFFPSISGDGRYAAFYSEATNFAPDDTNNFGDVYIRDREAKTTTRISLSSAGEQGEGGRSTYPRISSDGDFVTFVGFATNLVPNDTNALRDVFLRDLVRGTTTKVSSAPDGGDALGESTYPVVSEGGTLVAYHSTATNLVEADTNGVADVFLWERSTGETVRASVSSGGEQASKASLFAWVSADGRFLVFESAAPELSVADDNDASDVFLRDILAQTVSRLSSTPDGSPGDRGSSSAVTTFDGGLVAFGSDSTDLIADDTNGFADVFVVGLE